jgi:hypothetical protein
MRRHIDESKYGTNADMFDVERDKTIKRKK